MRRRRHAIISSMALTGRTLAGRLRALLAGCAAAVLHRCGKLYPHAVRVGRTKRPVQMAQHRFSSAGRHSSSSEYRLDAPAIAFSGVRRESFRGKAPRNMIWSLLEAVLAPFSGRNIKALGNRPNKARPNTKSPKARGKKKRVCFRSQISTADRTHARVSVFQSFSQTVSRTRPALTPPPARSPCVSPSMLA